jgi:hypothetical protein
VKLKGSCRVVMSVNFRHIVVFDVSKKVIVNFAMELTVNYYPGLVPGIFYCYYGSGAALHDIYQSIIYHCSTLKSEKKAVYL